MMILMIMISMVIMMIMLIMRFSPQRIARQQTGSLQHPHAEGSACEGAHRAQSVTWQSLGLQLGLRLPRPLRLESTLLALTYLAGPACVLHASGLAPPALPD